MKQNQNYFHYILILYCMLTLHLSDCCVSLFLKYNILSFVHVHVGLFYFMSKSKVRLKLQKQTGSLPLQ